MLAAIDGERWLVATLLAGLLVPAPVLADRDGDDGDDAESNPFEEVRITGAGDGHGLEAELDVHRFQAVNGGVVAVGLLRGRLTDRSGNVTRFEEEAVALPVATPGRPETQGVRWPARDAARGRALAVPVQFRFCPVLNLSFAPASLDLLGLVVDTAVVQLVVNAQPGAGNLLGNLLCEVTGLLDGFTPGAAPALAGALNDVAAAL